MTEIATEVSTEIITDAAVTVSNVPNIKASDVLFYGLLLYLAIDLLRILFELIRFTINMMKLKKVGIYIENLTEDQIKTIIETGKIETIDGVSFTLSMQKNITIPCQIIHKIYGRGRNELIISYNNEEYGISITGTDVDKYQIGDTVEVKMEILVTENNAETVQTLELIEDTNNKISEDSVHG